MIESHFINKFERKIVRKISKVYNNLRTKIGFKSVQCDQLRLASIKNLKTKLILARELSKKQPHRPEWRREVMNLAFWTNSEDLWEMFYDYHQVRQVWLEETGLSKLKLEFVPNSMAVGSLGQFQKMEFLVRAKELGMRSETQLTMLLPNKPELTNPALFRYIRPYLNVIEDEDLCQAMLPLEELLILPMEISLPIRVGCPHEEIAGNLIEQEWASQGRDAWLTLEDDHREKGQKIINNLGIPKDAWYVTLHMRETGFREPDSNTNLRNVDPYSYLKAIKCITDAGGWVFRMGNPKMKPLPELSQVIDYAHSSIRSDMMDVFLGATSRFCLATSSGYYVIPKAFGVPVLLTNSVQSLCYYSLTEKDIFLPCRMWKKDGLEALDWKEYFAPPVSYNMDEDFYKTKLKFQYNTQFELAEATKEMIAILDSKSKLKPAPLQTKIMQKIEKAGHMHGGFKVKPLASIASVFLENDETEN